MLDMLLSTAWVQICALTGRPESHFMPIWNFYKMQGCMSFSFEVMEPDNALFMLESKKKFILKRTLDTRNATVFNGIWVQQVRYLDQQPSDVHNFVDINCSFDQAAIILDGGNEIRRVPSPAEVASRERRDSQLGNPDARGVDLSRLVRAGAVRHAAPRPALGNDEIRWINEGF